MREKKYNREKVVEYAHKWAYSRNHKYYNYDAIGGDCTNFVSQCVYTGSDIMNYNKINGWYYINGNNKSPSWTGVEFLYNFLVNNNSTGPFAKQVEAQQIEVGDIAQLSFDGNKFSHSLVIVETAYDGNMSNILVTAHTFDADYKRISEYIYKKIRFISIEGVRI